MENGPSIPSDSHASDSDSDGYTQVPVRERVKAYADRNGIQSTTPTAAQAAPAQPTGARDGGRAASPSGSSSRRAHYRIGNPLRRPSLADLQDNRDLSARPVRIFVGTWNCVYQEHDESMILRPKKKDAGWFSKATRPAELVTHWLSSVFERAGLIHGGTAAPPLGGLEIKCHGADDNGIYECTLSSCTAPCSSNGAQSDAPLHSDCSEFEIASDDSAMREAGGTPLAEGASPRVNGALDECKSDDHTSPDLSIASTADDSPLAQASRPPQGGEASPTKGAQGEPSPRKGSLSSLFKANGRGGPGSAGEAAPGSNHDGETAATTDAVSHLQPPSFRHAGLKIVHRQDRPIIVRQTTLQLKPLTPNDREPLRDWIQPGYDIYIIALQETLSSRLFGSITKYLQSESSEPFERVPISEYKLSGYGDGAFLHMKSTSIALWVKKALLDSGTVCVGKSKAIPLSLINRSKGVVTFQMRVQGQVFGVVGCHLPTKYQDREKAAAYLIKKLAESYGGPGAALENVFHHILWTGDFNFRVTNISAETALRLLNANKRDELFFYDEFYHGFASTFSAFNFEEGVVRFFPTYKKRDDRDIVDRRSSGWAEAEYHTRYETQWYKGKNVKERVPSWTDRVLKWSLPALRTCLLVDSDTYRAAQPTVKNILMTSDHSPVGCGVAVWPVKSSVKLSARKNLDFGK